jgi:hypothetical protein
MYPLIRAGSICRFEPPLPEAEYQAGDILLFIAGNGTMVGHRYLGRKLYGPDGEELLLMKGDSNLTRDPPVARDQIIGRLVSIGRGGKQRSVNRVGLKTWGKLVLWIPLLSLAIHLFVRVIRKMQGMMNRIWALY